ncbi:MAG TPA: hypothetical protein VEW74_05595 [Candidatus Nitrosotalea sp.]|nr:hypothetical protein [Candidatus Nitrosotalea sp.]
MGWLRSEFAACGHLTTLSSSMHVLAPPETVWQNITNVQIDSSIPPRLFTLLGIPKPLHAELIEEPAERRRVAYFANGKRFTQKITSWKPLESYAFTFHADPGFKVVFVLDLAGGAFQLVSGEYHMTESGGAIDVMLTSTYLVRGAMRLFSFPIAAVMRAFQRYLLSAIKKSCEAP